MKNILKSVAIITLFTIFTRLSGFIFRIYMTRIIGAEGIGIYHVAFSIFAVLVTITASGIPLCVSRLTAKYNVENNNKSKFEVTSSALLIACSLALFLCVILLLGKNIFGLIFTDESCTLVLITMLPAVVFSAIHGVFRGYLWGENCYLSVCVIELIEQYVRIIACAIALNFAYSALSGAICASSSLSIAIFTSAILIVCVYKKKGGKLAPPKTKLKEVLNGSTPITSLRLVSSLIGPLISIIVPISLVHIGYTTEQSLELFGIAMGMAFPLLFLPTTIVDSLSIALISTLATAQAENNVQHIQVQINSAFNFASYIACMFLPIFIALGEPICIFLFDSAIAGDFLSKASLIIIPLAINGLTTTMLNSLNCEKQTFIYFLRASIVMILFLIISPYFVGINSIIVAYLVQNIIIFYFNVKLLIKKRYFYKRNLYTMFYMLFISLICGVVTYNVYSILFLFLPLIINLICSTIICILCFSLLCEITKLYNVKVILNKFNKKNILKKTKLN